MSLSYDGVEVKTVKRSIHSIVIPLAHIFNRSISTEIFSRKTETGQCNYNFKTENNNCNNFSRISLQDDTSLYEISVSLTPLVLTFSSVYSELT